MRNTVKQTDRLAHAARTGLPPYDGMLAAYHRAHEHELREMIADLPLRPGARVIDVACGDGAYSRWLAERVGPHGQVVGVDLSADYLACARAAADASPLGQRIALKQGDSDTLGFADGTFDLAWCAQSMLSLPNPRHALSEMIRVTRPGGTVAVFENDMLHHMLLPWPPEVELAVRRAQLAATARAGEQVDRFRIGSQVYVMMSELGLARCDLKAYVSVRSAPLAADERAFLQLYLDSLGAQVRQRLDPAMRSRFDDLSAAGSPLHMLNQPNVLISAIDMVVSGIRAA
jgi:ubiquinone/menaquinone biosynthesis C-methylase UbiE